MPPLTLAILFLTLLAVGASALAWRNLKRPPEAWRTLGLQHVSMGVIAAGAWGICLLRWREEPLWQPLSTHQDAFLLMDAIFASALLFLQLRPRLYGLSAFGSPLLALLLVWAICPTVVGTPFQGQTGKSAWLGLHLTTVFGSLAVAVISAVCGGMYLFVQRRLKDRKHLGRALNLVSLATLEDALIRSATLSFALFSIGLATGVVLGLHSHADEGASLAWLLSPKIILAVVAWLMYGLLMNVRYASAFRGKRAAWLAIIGLAVMMAVYGIALSASAKQTQVSPSMAPPATGGQP